MPLQRESKIPFVYYWKDWKPRGSEPIPVLRNQGEMTFLEEYDDKKRGKYFYPGCGVPCYRSPREERLPVDNDSIHWSHYPNYKDIYCSLRTSNSESCKAKSENEKQKAVYDEKLTIIRKWRDISDLSGYMQSKQEVNQYIGVNEDDSSNVLISSTNRHIGPEKPINRESSSLFLMGRSIERYLISKL